MGNEALPIEPRTYENHYKKTLKKLCMPELKFHGMRHSFVTRCIESKYSVNVDVPEIWDLGFVYKWS